MKKILFSLVVFLGLLTVCYAGAPESSAGVGLPVEYGGLRYSTSSFSIDGATITGWSVINSVFFTSGTTTDFVDIFRTTVTTVVNPHLNQVLRIYNVGNSTSSIAPALGRGISDAGNIRVGPIWMWKPSVAAYNMITILYEPQ